MFKQFEKGCVENTTIVLMNYARLYYHLNIFYEISIFKDIHIYETETTELPPNHELQKCAATVEHSTGKSYKHA